MRDKVVIELDGTAANNLHKLAANFGEDDAAEMVAIALGVMETLKPFLRDGIVTVIDPAAAEGEDLVDLVFPKLKARNSMAIT